jgi:hypothetical protein
LNIFREHRLENFPLHLFDSLQTCAFGVDELSS